MWNTIDTRTFCRLDMPYPCPQNTFLCTSWWFLAISFLQGSFRLHPQTSRGTTSKNSITTGIRSACLEKGKVCPELCRSKGKNGDRRNVWRWVWQKCGIRRHMGNREDVNVQHDLWRKGSVQTLLAWKNLKHCTYIGLSLQFVCLFIVSLFVSI